MRSNTAPVHLLQPIAFTAHPCVCRPCWDRSRKRVRNGPVKGVLRWQCVGCGAEQEGGALWMKANRDAECVRESVRWAVTARDVWVRVGRAAPMAWVARSRAQERSCEAASGAVASRLHAGRMGSLGIIERKIQGRVRTFGPTLVCAPVVRRPVGLLRRDGAAASGRVAEGGLMYAGGGRGSGAPLGRARGADGVLGHELRDWRRGMSCRRCGQLGSGFGGHLLCLKVVTGSAAVRALIGGSGRLGQRMNGHHVLCLRALISIHIGS